MRTDLTLLSVCSTLDETASIFILGLVGFNQAFNPPSSITKLTA